MSETRLAPGTSVTLVDARDPQRHTRAGIIMGYSGDALYNVGVFADGSQTEANPISIVKNVRVDDTSPAVGVERWRILTATGTGDLAGTVGNLVARIEKFEHTMAEAEKARQAQQADLSQKYLAAIRTIAQSVSVEFGRVVETAITTGIVQTLNPTSQPAPRRGTPRPAESELVGAGK